MVMAGLIVGHGLHKQEACKELQSHMSIFWKVLDEIFNSVLFVLIGIEVIALDFRMDYVLLGLVSVVVVLLARYIAVSLANIFLKKDHRSPRRERIILTWAGLRGGISIALALTLPEGEIRDAILFVTYIVVIFSIIVQGLTIEKLVLKLTDKN